MLTRWNSVLPLEEESYSICAVSSFYTKVHYCNRNLKEIVFPCRDWLLDWQSSEVTTRLLHNSWRQVKDKQLQNLYVHKYELTVNLFSTFHRPHKKHGYLDLKTCNLRRTLPSSHHTCIWNVMPSVWILGGQLDDPQDHVDGRKHDVQAHTSRAACMPFLIPFETQMYVPVVCPRKH